MTVESITTTLPLIYTIIAAVTVLFFGIVIGWILTKDSENTSKEKLKIGIAIAVTIIWMITVISEIIISSYSISPIIHAIMGAVVGYFFTEDGLNVSVGK